MVRRAENELDPRPVGQRLRLTREALRLTQRDFALGAEIQPTTYGQYETGARLISPARAIELCQTYQLTLDWIYMGELAGLPYRLAAAIKALQELERQP